MPQASRKKNERTKREVLLVEKDIFGGRCTMLTPSPITNSGKADGGWMDRIGISTVANLSSIFETSTPVECFYSNDAYAKAGFCTMHLELHPANTKSSPEELAKYLENYLMTSENDDYRRGNYRKLEDVTPLIHDPSTIGSTATWIVQRPFEVPITPGPGIPKGLTATTYSALLYFEGKGIVLLKANNVERHSPPLDYQTILSSISYKSNETPNRGSSSFMGEGLMDDLYDSPLHKAARARVACMSYQTPQYCLACGADSQPDNGGELLACGRCKVATYCQRSCATSDWKRHKKAECRPKSL
jgi:hypothetical protein